MTPQGTYNLFMLIGAVGTGMVLIGFVGAWLISAKISRNSENEVTKLSQEVSVQRKNLGVFAQPLEPVHEGNEAEQHLIFHRIRRGFHDSMREVS